MDRPRSECKRLASAARCALVGLLLAPQPVAAQAIELDAGSNADALVLAEALAARSGAAEVNPPGEEALWQRAQALVRITLEHGCQPYLLGQPGNAFGESSAACDAFLSAALVSLALDQPERTAVAAAAVEALIAHALQPAGTTPFRSTGWTRIAGERLPRSVLYQGFLLLALAGLERLAPDNPRSALFDALASALGQRLDASAAGFLPTYGDRMVWPCDHAPALSALILHGQLRPAQATHSRRAAAALERRLAELLDRRPGFATRIAPSGKVLEATPRGVTMAWTAGFLVAGDPTLARRFGRDFEQRFCRRHLGLAACREWPPGVERPADASSGPIVLGFGIGASALGMAASRALGDDGLHRALLRTAHLAGIERLLDQPDRYPLENAIYLWARSARPWTPGGA